ncbi:hypothetical protein A3E39_00010 [Candidatus Uhrbacteria bacterium RIFCSPHIGHO2_12_FULL_60_25]|uniref:DUF11 domain-containing protein n=1 Tax=Candidatus Uhrbacteria bacterium RIFCSPHIGHO2_12_FULL_60_25 TaxID=1802399 RepID=A0A1F7UMN2_9BACT|nr:MAG: hypothetical protein A3D73_02775 [Candidatus Uhrbacteria bacterium RIFCSPHIGHO2_02_FULL_60_44]OGL79495.1 MAG: hypothetical protein A3E39_00010 [Candidatus Uhrbacteria bacterium RIFCSPHIGHO2_12_FULL_60_25]
MGSRKERRREREEKNRLSHPDGATQATKTDDVTASLTAIYGESPAEAKDLLQSMEHARRRTWLAILIGAALLLVLVTSVAWAGFWWWGSRSASGTGIELSIEGPSRVSLGQEATYFVNWFNRSKEPLAALELRVSFPNDFVVTSIDPKPTIDTMTFRLGSQSVEARGTVKVTGTFTGALGTTSAVQVIGTYRPASSNTDEEELQTLELEYTDTVLEGDLVLPGKVLPGDKVTAAYAIQNKGADAMKDLKARIRLPDGFVPDASFSADAGVVSFPLGTIEAGSSSTVRVTGTFSLGSHGEAVFQAETGRVTPDGTFAAAERSDATVSVLAGDLNVKLVVNGSDKNRSASLGERERIAISYENTSGEELHDVVLKFHMGGDPPVSPLPKSTSSIDLVDWKQLDDPTGGRRDHDTVTYTKDQISQLETLAPDANGLIELTVPLNDYVTTSRDVPVLALVEATIGAVDKVKVNRTVKTEPIRITFQTDAMLEAVARYASEEGATLGKGPLPPVVGTSTTYRVEWMMAKTLHALERVTVSANVPKNVAFGGVKETGAGEVAYDPDLRLVTWTINRVPQDVHELVTSFDLVLTPFVSDAGRFADLLGESRFEFTDAGVGEPLLRTAPSLTTDLPDDDLAKGKGVVKK